MRILVVGALLALLIVFTRARDTAVDSFFQRVELSPDTVLTSPRGEPRALFAINIDPETNAAGVIDVTPPPPPPPPPADTDTAKVRPEKTIPDRRPDLNLDDLLDKEAGPRGGASSTEAAAVPPRPIEITWPETRQLKQCIGQSVNVRIWVSEEGRVKDVQVVPSGALPACLDAALSAARHIRFEPGRQGGVAVTMWTEVRIDFQRRD
jgi:protein TonB